MCDDPLPFAIQKYTAEAWDKNFTDESKGGGGDKNFLQAKNFWLYVTYFYLDHELLEFIVSEKARLVVRGRVRVTTKVLHVVDGHL